MKHIEDALRKLPEAEEPTADPRFRQQLRRELLATRESRRLAHRPLPLLAAGLAMACLLLFVVRPDLPRDLHNLVTGSTAPGQVQPRDPLAAMLVRETGTAMPVVFNDQGHAGAIRSVEQERILVIREVILENGERAMVVSELEPPKAKPYSVY